ncbi:MAG: sulfotransferase domain-containing protein [Acidimicrobiales bacterium]
MTASTTTSAKVGERSTPPRAKALAKSALSVWARATHRIRVLPDFVIIGAQRGGTTSLYNYLADHPSVGRAFTKELRYFDVGYEQGPAWYRSRFPTSANLALRARRHGAGIAGEASPDYLFYPLAPRRLSAVVPDAKLIVLLRDPVERAWSHWWHQVRRGHEALTFDEAIAAEDSRLSPGLLDIDADAATLTFHDHHHSYAARGVYAPQLERWWRVVPREQTLVLRSEDLFDRPATVFEEVLDFLELPHWQPPTFESLNRMAAGAMSAGAQASLVEHFRPHNRRLADLLGQDLGWDGS